MNPTSYNKQPHERKDKKYKHYERNAAENFVKSNLSSENRKSTLRDRNLDAFFDLTKNDVKTINKEMNKLSKEINKSQNLNLDPIKDGYEEISSLNDSLKIARETLANKITMQEKYSFSPNKKKTEIFIPNKKNKLENDIHEEVFDQVILDKTPNLNTLEEATNLSAFNSSECMLSYENLLF